jgi:hypothetical protein
MQDVQAAAQKFSMDTQHEEMDIRQDMDMDMQHMDMDMKPGPGHAAWA